MPTPLSQYPRPKNDTGLGLHDSSNVGANPSNIEAHAKALRAAGISWYKILEAGGNKIERCRTYLAHDIMPIVRLYKERPHPDYVVFPGEVARYVAAGVRYFEMGNEPNISPDEWQTGKWPSAADMGRIIAEQWVSASAIVKREGGIPLVYAMTPEGTYSHAGGHRRITIDFLQHLKTKGRLDTLEGAGVAIHPRPHNNPPDTPTTATNTVTFNEYQWFAQTYKELVGWVPPFFATEHGYSIGDSQNTNYPRIDEHLWTDHNQKLFERMNPSHPKAIPPYMFALCYWLETEGGTWANDNLSNGWFPDGLRHWGQRLAGMRVTWNRTITNPTPAPQPAPQPQPQPGGPVSTIPPKPPVEWRGSPNFTQANASKSVIVWHHTGGALSPSLAWLLNPSSGVSADYLISKAGKIYQLVADEDIAWHAGFSRMPDGREDVNRIAYGVELENAGDGKDPYPEAQIAAAVALARHLVAKNNIPRSGNVTHELIRRLWKEKYPNRTDVSAKTDPRGLDMKMVLDRIYAPTPVPVPAPTPAPVDALVKLAKEAQAIAPNWAAAIAKAAAQAGYTSPLGNEVSLKDWICQLWAAQGKPEAVFYVKRGDWGNVKFKTL